MLNFHYKTLRNCKDRLDEFAQMIGASPAGNYVQPPSFFGDGYIYADIINKDISFTIMDFVLNDHIYVLTDYENANDGLEIFFNQLQVSDHIRFCSGNQNLEASNQQRNSVYLISARQRYEIWASKGTHVKCISVSFGPGIVQQFVSSDTLMTIQSYAQKVVINECPDFINFEMQKLLNEIFRTDHESNLGKLIIQNRVLMLLENFFHTLLMKENKPSTSQKNPVAKKEDMERLKAIEQKLKSDDLEEFPSIDVLSKMAMMSATKLKDKFKKVYGMKLYEYYSRYRLYKAKEMIVNNNVTVKDAAYSIGYSNISNFSNAFRKEFGVLPSVLRK